MAGVTPPLPPPFFVLATQNPIEMEGTYPLPEAQLDRFLFKLRVRYPALEELNEIIDRTTSVQRADRAAGDDGQRGARRSASSSARCRSRRTSGSSRPRS